jgi:hypothetical protein
MVTYPIVIRRTPKGDRIHVLFPDFEGCTITLKTDESESVSAFHERVQTEALRYLAGTPAYVGWVAQRLRGGYRVNQPNTRSMDDLLRPTDTMLEVTFSGDLETALIFHWSRLEMDLDLPRMAAVLELDPERYRLIEQYLVRPNHREKARLRNLQQRSQRIYVGPANIRAAKQAAS